MIFSRYTYLLLAGVVAAASPTYAQVTEFEEINELEAISAEEEAKILMQMDEGVPLASQEVQEAVEVIEEAVESDVAEEVITKVPVEIVEEIIEVPEEGVATTLKEPVDLGERIEPALKDALSKAYNKNPELEAQRRAFQASVEQVPQALAGALPNANIAYSKGKQRTRSNGTDWASSDSEAKSLSVVQPIFRGGTTYANTKSARRQVDAALQRLVQIEQNTLLEAITAYVEVVRATAVYELSQKNRDVLDRQREAASQRFAVGEDTRTDVAQSRARLALASSDVINSKGQLESAKATYLEEIGEAPTSLKALTKLPELPGTLEQYIALAMEHNPTVREAELLEKAADHNIDANVGTLLPSVNLEGTVSRREGTGVFGNNDFDQDQLIVSATLPIFTGGSRYSQIRQAKEAYHQSRFQVADIRNQVRSSAVATWEQLQAAIATIKSNRLAIEAAQVALEGVRQEQQYGSRTTLDVLDAERELFNAEVQLVIAERNKIVAAYSVLGVLGRLTARNMGLDVSLYDAEGYYDDTEYQFIGF